MFFINQAVSVGVNGNALSCREPLVDEGGAANFVIYGLASILASRVCSLGGIKPKRQELIKITLTMLMHSGMCKFSLMANAKQGVVYNTLEEKREKL